MSSGNTGVSRHAFLDTIEASVSLGIAEKKELLCAAGFIDASELPPERVPEQQLYRLWQYLDEQSRAGRSHSDYGLRMGQRINPNTKGLLASWVSQCQNLGEALRVFTQNSKLMSTIDTFSFRQEPEGVVIETRLNAPCDLPQAYVERTMAALVAWGQHLTGQPLKPIRASFRWSKPRHAAAYPSVFGNSLQFESDRNCLIFANSALTQPVVSANAYLKERLGQEARNRVRQLETATSLTARMSALIRENLDDPTFSITRACKELGTSRQTVYRKLKAEGTGFSEIQDQMRKEQARALISNPQITYSELSYRLGFKDPSSGHKALKRWFGKPLSELR